MKQYEVIADYHPTISGKPTKEPLLLKGDILTQMDTNDSRFLSRDDDTFALYEYTLQSYPQFFKAR